MAGNLEFRVAAPYDAPRIQQLVQAAFRAQDSRKAWTADMELSAGFTISVDDVLPKITKPDSAILIATAGDDNQLVASIEMAKRSGRVARLSMLAVDQSHQRGGFGRLVLTSAEDYCTREWNVTKFSLNALSTREELIAWYMRCGYRKTGELTPFPLERIGDRAVPQYWCFVELDKEVA